MKDYINTSHGNAVIERPREDAQNARVYVSLDSDLAILMPQVERLAHERGVISILIETRTARLGIPLLTELGYTYVCSKPNNKVLMAKILKYHERNIYF